MSLSIAARGRAGVEYAWATSEAGAATGTPCLTPAASMLEPFRIYLPGGESWSSGGLRVDGSQPTTMTFTAIANSATGVMAGGFFLLQNGPFYTLATIG